MGLIAGMQEWVNMTLRSQPHKGDMVCWKIQLVCIYNLGKCGQKGTSLIGQRVT